MKKSDPTPMDVSSNDIPSSTMPIPHTNDTLSSISTDSPSIVPLPKSILQHPSSNFLDTHPRIAAQMMYEGREGDDNRAGSTVSASASSSGGHTPIAHKLLNADSENVDDDVMIMKPSGKPVKSTKSTVKLPQPLPKPPAAAATASAHTAAPSPVASTSTKATAKRTPAVSLRVQAHQHTPAPRPSSPPSADSSENKSSRPGSGSSSGQHKSGHGHMRAPSPISVSSGSSVASGKEEGRQRKGKGKNPDADNENDTDLSNKPKKRPLPVVYGVGAGVGGRLIGDPNVPLTGAPSNSFTHPGNMKHVNGWDYEGYYSRWSEQLGVDILISTLLLAVGSFFHVESAILGMAGGKETPTSGITEAMALGSSAAGGSNRAGGSAAGNMNTGYSRQIEDGLFWRLLKEEGERMSLGPDDITHRWKEALRKARVKLTPATQKRIHSVGFTHGRGSQGVCLQTFKGLLYDPPKGVSSGVLAKREQNYLRFVPYAASSGTGGGEKNCVCCVLTQPNGPPSIQPAGVKSESLSIEPSPKTYYDLMADIYQPFLDALKKQHQGLFVSIENVAASMMQHEKTAKILTELQSSIPRSALLHELDMKPAVGGNGAHLARKNVFFGAAAGEARASMIDATPPTTTLILESLIHSPRFHGWLLATHDLRIEVALSSESISTTVTATATSSSSSSSAQTPDLEVAWIPSLELSRRAKVKHINPEPKRVSKVSLTDPWGAGASSSHSDGAGRSSEKSFTGGGGSSTPTVTSTGRVLQEKKNWPDPSEPRPQHMKRKVVGPPEPPAKDNKATSAAAAASTTGEGGGKKGEKGDSSLAKESLKRGTSGGKVGGSSGSDNNRSKEGGKHPSVHSAPQHIPPSAFVPRLSSPDPPSAPPAALPVPPRIPKGPMKAWNSNELFSFFPADPNAATYTRTALCALWTREQYTLSLLPPTTAWLNAGPVAPIGSSLIPPQVKALFATRGPASAASASAPATAAAAVGEELLVTWRDRILFEAFLPYVIERWITPKQIVQVIDKAFPQLRKEWEQETAASMFLASQPQKKAGDESSTATFQEWLLAPIESLFSYTEPPVFLPATMLDLFEGNSMIPAWNLDDPLGAKSAAATGGAIISSPAVAAGSSAATVSAPPYDTTTYSRTQMVMQHVKLLRRLPRPVPANETFSITSITAKEDEEKGAGGGISSASIAVAIAAATAAGAKGDEDVIMVDSAASAVETSSPDSNPSATSTHCDSDPPGVRYKFASDFKLIPGYVPPPPAPRLYGSVLGRNAAPNNKRQWGSVVASGVRSEWANAQRDGSRDRDRDDSLPHQQAKRRKMMPSSGGGVKSKSSSKRDPDDHKSAIRGTDIRDSDREMDDVDEEADLGSAMSRSSSSENEFDEDTGGRSTKHRKRPAAKALQMLRSEIESLRDQTKALQDDLLEVTQCPCKRQKETCVFPCGHSVWCERCTSINLDIRNMQLEDGRLFPLPTLSKKDFYFCPIQGCAKQIESIIRIRPTPISSTLD